MHGVFCQCLKSIGPHQSLLRSAIIPEAPINVNITDNNNLPNNFIDHLMKDNVAVEPRASEGREFFLFSS